MDSNAYPGLYDGLIISAAFIDSDASRFQSWDCKLMWDHFASRAPSRSPTAQKEAVAGFIGNCNSHVSTTRYEVYNPSVARAANSRGAEVPRGDQSQRRALHAAGLPGNQVGRRPDGFANTRLDNVGVQYGLKALLSDAISPAQFVELNAAPAATTSTSIACAPCPPTSRGCRACTAPGKTIWRTTSTRSRSSRRAARPTTFTSRITPT